jgi:hypothetical protein
VKKPCRKKFVPLIEPIPSKKNGNFVMETPSTKLESLWGRRSIARGIKYEVQPVPCLTAFC